MPCGNELESDMTTIFSAMSQGAIAGPSGGFFRRIGLLAHAVLAYWERRSAIKILSERDDRELRDIGILRSQIEAAVGGAFNPHRAGWAERRYDATMPL
jgi:uncharacterized protein YjiS (DUF1127 family)